MTPEQTLFRKLVEAYAEAKVCTKSYTDGLFDAYVILTGVEAGEAVDQLYGDRDALAQQLALEEEQWAGEALT